MARGVEQSRLDHRFLHRRDLVVHAAARRAYEYHRRFQVPSPRLELERPASASPIFAVVFASRIDDRYHVIRDFPVFHRFGNEQTTEKTATRRGLPLVLKFHMVASLCRRDEKWVVVAGDQSG